MTRVVNHGPARLVAFVGLTVLTAAVLPGCGGSGTGDLAGKITHKGKPVASGSVSAVGSDGIAHGAQIGTDGSYSLTGLPVGEVKITVSSPNPATLGQGGGRGAGGGGRGKEGRQPPGEQPLPPDPEVVKKWFPIPENYGDIAKTSLRATVKRGPTTHDIDLP